MPTHTPPPYHYVPGELQMIPDQDGVPMPMVYWRGLCQPQFAGLSDRLNSLHDGRFVFRSNDVWIMAYAKSGTHWLHEVASMLIRASVEPSPDKTQFMIEREDTAKFNDIPVVDNIPRLLNGHLFYSQVMRIVSFISILVLYETIGD